METRDQERSSLRLDDSLGGWSKMGDSSFHDGNEKFHE
jgi:hypothetical protein